MRVSREQYHSFSTPLEGRVHSAYVDVKGLITVGVGNLIDPISLAERLPWTVADGSPADLAQVRADWHKLKDAAGHYSKLHWKFAADATKIRLTDEAIDALVDRQLAANEASIKRRFPAWDSFPADAQLAIMSIAWAVGAGFAQIFGNLARCIDAQDWEGCVATCKIREEGNPGIVPRNAKNRFCFHNAALVKAGQLDGARLFWPDVAIAPQAIGDSPLRAATVAAKGEAEAALNDFVNSEAVRIEQRSSSQAIREYEEAGLVDDHDDPPPGVA